MSSKQEIISNLFRKGVLVTPTILQKIDAGMTYDQIISNDTVEKNTQQQVTQQSTQQAPSVGKDSLPLDENQRAPLHITFSYEDNAKKFSVEDFVSLFNKRLEALSSILRQRTELEGLTSIRRLADMSSEQRKQVSIIGYVLSKRETKNGHLMLEVEDKTGTVKVLINANRQDVFTQGEQLVMDDVIGVNGTLAEGKGDMIFANSILFPDVPMMEYKKSPCKVKCVFTSDLHYGAKLFMKNAFADFIKWINGETTTGKEREEVMQIKYLFLVGDLVEGVGVYPNQENDLEILDVEEQYNALAKELAKIRKDIHIIACGGNHDAMRIAEPQPVFYEKYCHALYALDNFTAVSSPSMVTVARTDHFPGIDVLMYHGYSFPYYFDGVDFLRQAGGIDRMDLVMEFLLKRRHLAPTHTSTQYVPDGREDFLVIKKVPDIFATGHVHKVTNKNYKNVTMLNCSAWFGETDYMLKRGIIAEPAKVLLVDLHTRDVQVVDFEREDRS